VSQEVNRKLPARNTTVQLLTFYTPAQHYRLADRQTVRQTTSWHQ